MSMERALAEIEAQQAKEKGRTAPWMVGEQLREICMREPKSAELIAQDLTTGGMSLREAETKIRAYADKHKTGNFACVTPAKAEDILRKYFGLPAAAGDPHPSPAGDTFPQGKAEGEVIDLADFF